MKIDHYNLAYFWQPFLNPPCEATQWTHDLSCTYLRGPHYIQGVTWTFIYIQVKSCVQWTASFDIYKFINEFSILKVTSIVLYLNSVKECRNLMETSIT